MYLWEILNKNIYSIFDKNKQKAANRMLLLFLKTSNRFLKVVAVRHSRWKVFQKQTFHSTSTIYLLRCLTEKQIQLINIKTTHPNSLTFFSNFLSCDSRVFIFFVFCISSNKLNRNRHFLSFKGKHSESCSVELLFSYPLQVFF